MEIHIGSLIKSKAKSIRLGPTELGIRLETSKQNVYGIFKRKSIDTELLARISIALGYDFFQPLSKALNDNSAVGTPASQNGKASHPNIQDGENAYLKKINTLLEEKVARLESMVSERV